MQTKLINLILGAVIGAGIVLIIDSLYAPTNVVFEDLPEPYYAEVIVNGPDGIPQKENLVKGLTLNLPPQTHSIENRSSTSLHSILVEFKNNGN